MTQIAPGAHIEVRDAVWRVVRVDQTSTGKAAWRCVGVSEIVRDREALFLEELERKVTVLDPRETNLVRDTSSQHRAGLLYIESLLRDVPPTGPELTVGHRAAMDELPFQLEPAYKALGKLRQRILIADAVGLGKTMAAGVLLSELIRRGRGRRILVATVKSMLTQFQKEMWCRFSIPLVRLDSVGLQRIRAQIPTHHNPFYYFDKSIISIDTLKQNNAFRAHVEQARWDVIVIDEAHNVAVRGQGRSQRAGIAQVLAQNCDSMILLSATPHDGRPRSFASLMNMLDPTAIANPDDYTKDDIKGLFVRRHKADVATQLGRSFPERKIYKARARATAEEEEAFHRLTALSFSRIDRRAHGGMLFRMTLEKALFSSPAACIESIDERIKRLGRHDEAGTFADDVAALGHLREAVGAITPARFSKYQELLQVIKKNMSWKASRARDDRLVIFTERRATLTFLEQQLKQDLELNDGQVEQLHGGLSDTEQQRLVEEFGKAGSRLRLLLASDVASEGINLHFLCHRLIHFDVPWSLMVFQQRNGRVDRYGQEHQPLMVYMLTESDNEAIRGDQRILDVLIDKDHQASKNIGDPSAFMNVYDVEQEEQITAREMAAKTTAEAFGARLDAQLSDPFLDLIAEAAEKEQAADGVASRGSVFRVPRRELPSLYAGDFDYARTALEHLKADGLKAEIDPGKKLIELTWTDDLQQRYQKLPVEVRPDDGRVLLTADAGRMQRAMAEARREELAWPRHQYLWANNPVVEWLGDRLRSGFGRHTAPVLALPGWIGIDEVAVIVSGLLPNQRSQPLVHRWYVAIFRDLEPVDVEDLGSFLERTGLSGRGMPNREDLQLDMGALRALLPRAVQIVSDHIGLDRAAFERKTRARLDAELARLDRLLQRQHAWIRDKYGIDPRKAQQRDAHSRRVNKLFSSYQRWAKEAMTTAESPFLQVIAVLCHASGELAS